MNAINPKLYLATLISYVAASLCVGAFTMSDRAWAQIVPDRSLGNANSTIAPSIQINGRISDRIDGGAMRGGNLFHSFQQFNIESGRGAYFTNPNNITNIFSRVTGNLPSNILGTLGVLGNANLFFINPNGIIFGPDSSLDLKGSFLASTASSIHFADNNEFTAKPGDLTQPLLTVSAPIGLVLNSTSGDIINRSQNSVLLPSSDPNKLPTSTMVGLQVQPGSTLTLLGGYIWLDGGYLTAPGGRIELGSINSYNNSSAARVGLIPTATGFSLAYDGIRNFGDIQLSNLSKVDASSLGGGNIQLQGKDITLREGSQILANTLGDINGGNIVVRGSQSVTLLGSTLTKGPIEPRLAAAGIIVPRETSISTRSFGAGNAGNLTIQTGKLTVANGSIIASQNFGLGRGGNLTIEAADSVEVFGKAILIGLDPTRFINFGTSESSPEVFREAAIVSNISTASIGDGTAGDMAIKTGRLVVRNGGIITSNPLFNGGGGNLTVLAAESVEVFGISSGGIVPSTITATAFGNGDAKDVIIETKKLSLRESGSIGVGTAGSGRSGNLSVTASEFVELSGKLPNATTASRLNANTSGSGTAGNLTVKTERIIVRDGAEISVDARSAGAAGNLSIDTKQLYLDNGNITAATAVGNGGNISLQSRDIQLRGNSVITASASNTANGGNLAINTNTLAALEGSNITASAIQGNGGNIQINTQGLFRSDASVISASSLLGIDGILEIKTPELNLQNSLAPIAITFTNPNSLIADSCLTRRNAGKGSFVITGTGGLPRSPYDDKVASRYYVADLQGQSVNSEIESIQDRHSNTSNQAQVEIPISNHTSPKAKYPIQEAQSLTVSPAGRILLTTLPQQGNINSANLVCP